MTCFSRFVVQEIMLSEPIWFVVDEEMLMNTIDPLNIVDVMMLVGELLMCKRGSGKYD